MQSPCFNRGHYWDAARPPMLLITLVGCASPPASSRTLLSGSKTLRFRIICNKVKLEILRICTCKVLVFTKNTTGMRPAQQCY